ncbi:hypothetical protein FEM48_Zijuj10G0049400 [Ziziphus jujuba var. spinosa]|uniref:GDSL esterase/lipase At3g26430-like n=1 Tax=Ziziphus jujuba var. spinosa TaxID=714518 RepID=A0A978ULF1_ZIZJJ|nr:hypothetical protein FEM48_Zijuj10G0049400 [Ziziphus jujuba var. spinosa]
MESRYSSSVFLFLLWVVLSFPSSTFGLRSCHFPAIFNFGDSNSDTGAESLGLPYLSAYLDSVGSNFSHGANFATAGSTIRPQNTTISQSGYSPISLNAYVPDVLSQLYNTIKNVYGQGGRSFWIHNTGPVGCLPYILDRYLVTAAQIDKYGCATPFNEVAQYFNIRLKALVAQLRKDLPEAAITYVDVYSVKYTLISQAKKYGFKLPLVACCGHGGKYNFNNNMRCGSKKTIKGKEVLIAKSCSNPSVRINWDGIHFTEAANKWIFEQISDGSFSDPPIPLKMACHRMDL